MWAVVEVSDGYPHGGCHADRVWLFDSEELAEEYAAKQEDNDEAFVYDVVQVSHIRWEKARGGV